MRKSFLALAFCSALATQPGIAAEKGLYLGADYTYTHFNYKDTLSSITAENYNGYEPYIGYQFNKNMAFELGYSGMLSESKNSGPVSVDTKFWSFYGDLVGKYPINRSLSLLGSIGYERLTVDNNINSSFGGSSVSKDTNAGRLGLGAEWMVTPNVGLRGVVRYVVPDFNGVDNYVQGSVGINYHFN